jgi:hypothetical protein
MALEGRIALLEQERDQTRRELVWLHEELSELREEVIMQWATERLRLLAARIGSSRSRRRWWAPWRVR